MFVNENELYSPMDSFETYKIQTNNISSEGRVSISYTNAVYSLFMLSGFWALSRFKFVIYYWSSYLLWFAYLSNLFIIDLIKQLASSKGLSFFEYSLFLFLLVLTFNMSGILPDSFAFTAQIILVGTLGYSTVVGLSARAAMVLTWKNFLLIIKYGIPLLIQLMLIVIEFLSYFAKPLSLSVRLFANILAGHILMHIIGGFLFGGGSNNIFYIVGPGSVYLCLMLIEVLIAGLQSYVFTVMGIIYTGDVISESSH